MSRYLQAIIAISGVLLLAVGCEELRIDNGLLSTTGNAFQCSSDDDCIEPFQCEIEDDAEIGVCAAQGPGVNCARFDSDNDQFLTANEDVPDSCQGARGDCDDNDPLTNPDAVEICDGIDNDCNGEIDDGIEPTPCARQLGVCGDVNDGEGALAECVDGAFENCGDTGKYGPDFEATEVSCDGLDNNCDGDVDEQCCDADLPTRDPGACNFDACNVPSCVCSPGDAFECSTATGTCSRGVKVCSDSGVLSDQPCMAVVPEVASALTSCEGDASACAEDEVCVREFVGTDESFDDECTELGDPACERKVCRTVATTGQSCDSDSDCDGADEICYDGECRPAATEAVAEICNGLDDDCNGAIDNGAPAGEDQGSASCGSCRFNMVRIQGFADLQNPSGTRFAYCIDRYEASKPDATADSQGENELYSVSRAGVLPWTGLSRAEAQAACEATAYNENVGVADQLDSNRLCPASVWSQTCGGLVGGQQRDYIYGDTFEEGSCVDGRDGTNTPQPSGSLSSCSRTLSASALYFDLTGNVWEWISDRPAAGQNRVAWMLGGSYAWPETTAGTEGVVKEGAMICIPDLQAIESQDLLRCSDQSQCATRPGTTCVDGRCRDSCTTDADCSAFLRCQTAQDDGSDYCFHFSETLPDADSGDWSDYNNVGFRCCRP